MSEHAAGLARAREHYVSGRLEQARAVLARILSKAPADSRANASMAHVQLLLNQRAQALFYAERALPQAPPDSGFLMELGKVFVNLDRPRHADDLLREAVRLSPDAPQPKVSLAAHYMTEGRYATAAAVCREGLGHAPEHPDLSSNLALSLTAMGRAAEGVGVLRRAIGAAPDNLTLWSNFVFTLNSIPGVSPREVLEAHRAYGRTLAARTPSRPAPDRPADPDRRLTVGFLSPDLVGHSVEYFIRPVLDELDRAHFRVVCFVSGPPVTGSENRRQRSDASRALYALTQEQYVRAIHEEGTDILVELSGHTHRGNLPGLRLGLAPVQCTYLGYPNTTGHPDVSVRFVDSLTDPSPTADELATEHLVRLDPCFLCYSPPADAPAVAAPPGTGGALVTFGSFNAVSKLNDEVIRLWVRVLDAVPGSRLRLKSSVLREEEVRADLSARFGAAGLDPARVLYAPWAKDHAEHMGMYGRVDVALDPFPYNGTTTTADALWMGVPVVTLAGNVHAGRVGLSMLTAAGFPELVAGTPDEYVRIAARLALDRARLAGLRASMRDRVARSALCDAPGMGRRFGEALRAVWRGWCARRRS